MDTWPYPLWIAHRGAGKLAPENTLAAFRVGAAHGYRAFECDVKLSADGVPFLLHDATLQRTTPARGTAGERPWSELSRLDAGGWHSRAFAGEPMPEPGGDRRLLPAQRLRAEHRDQADAGPRAARPAAWWRARRRGCGPLTHGRGAAAAAQLVPPRGAAGRARETAPQLPRALLLDTLWSGWFDIARALDCVACVTNHSLMDAGLIAQLHARRHARPRLHGQRRRPRRGAWCAWASTASSPTRWTSSRPATSVLD